MFVDKKMVECLGLIKASKNRSKTFCQIGNKDYITPSEISNSTGIIINHVSNILKDLKLAKLIKCVNDESKKGRLYVLTENGKKIYEYILKEKMYDSIIAKSKKTK